uniref:ABC transporter transmembrane domain-containing protein n=1 Tax=Paracoccus binzhouensis TaxID=2796149 RepID=UPI0022B93D5B
RAGAFAALAGDQAALLRPFAARHAVARLRVAVLPAAILACAFAVSWAAGLILLLAGPAIPLFMALIGHAAGRASRAQLDGMTDMGALLADRVGALPDIRLLGASAALAGDFARAAEGLRRAAMRVLGIAFLSSTVLELFAALGIAMMAVFCGFSLLGEIGFGTWDGPLTVAQALFLLLIAPEFFQPLRELAAAWHNWAAADAAARALAAELRVRPVIAGQGAPA